jgi:hypothetical protein
MSQKEKIKKQIFPCTYLVYNDSSAKEVLDLALFASKANEGTSKRD